MRLYVRGCHLARDSSTRRVLEAVDGAEALRLIRSREVVLVISDVLLPGPGSRHEMFGKLGIKCRNLRDPDNHDATGVMAEIPDMAAFQDLLESDEGKRAMQEDGLKVETMRMLVEFTP